MFFFFNDTATTEIYTLSLHDALPICLRHAVHDDQPVAAPSELERRRYRTRVRDPAVDLVADHPPAALLGEQDRKSTRLNSSHANISYAVFCLKKKKTKSIKAQRTYND